MTVKATSLKILQKKLGEWFDEFAIVDTHLSTEPDASKDPRAFVVRSRNTLSLKQKLMP